MASLGEMLRAARLRKKLSQTQLAERLGVTKGAISQWETGIGYPKRSNARQLADALGINPRNLEAMLMSGINLLDGEPRGREILLYEFASLAHVDLVGNRKGVKPKFKAQEVGHLLGDPDIPADAVAARIADDSMGPEFMPGDLVIFSKGIAPVRDDIVVAVLGEDDAILRRYEPRGRNKAGEDVFDLISTSPDHHTVSSNSAKAVRLLGTVVEHRRKRRS